MVTKYVRELKCTSEQSRSKVHALSPKLCCLMHLTVPFDCSLGLGLFDIFVHIVVEYGGASEECRQPKVSLQQGE